MSKNTNIKKDKLSAESSSNNHNNNNDNIPYDLPPPYSSNVNDSRGVAVEEDIKPYPEVLYNHTPPPLPSTPLLNQANPTYSAETVFLSSPVPLKALKTKPTITTCPHCKAIVLSRTKFKSGSATLLSSLGLFLVGLTSCCCCLFPFCINDLKDCVHSCPNCGKIMAKYSRLEGKAHIK